MRIWVTGIGIVSPLAIGALPTMDRLCEGQRALSQVSLFDVRDQRTTIAAEVRGLLPSEQAAQRCARSRTASMAVAAAREALQQAGVSTRSERVDLVVGGTTGPMFETEEHLAQFLPQSTVAASMAELIAYPLSTTTDDLRAQLGPFRRARTLSSACSTGTQALVLAAAWLVTGRSERVLAGAADALCRLTFTGFNALGSLDPEPCRPFDKARAGLSLGEGAAFLLLELDTAARARGASPIAELAGWAAAAEAHHITNPEPDGATAARVIRAAIECAGLEPRDVDYVNAHGTATLLNDPMEIRALRSVFGTDINRLVVSSSKGQIGHSLGAAGAIESAIAALAVHQERVPPTGGLQEIDPECEANHVLGRFRPMPVRAAVANSLGFGGLDSAVVFARAGYPPERRVRPRTAVGIAGAGIVGTLGPATLERAAVYAEPGPAPNDGAIDCDVEAHLELTKARRFGRAERLMAAAMAIAIRDAGHSAEKIDRTRMGLVAGMASGSLDGVARFLKKVRDRGPRHAPPADFPGLMLSATAGYASIYHGVRGPVLSTADKCMSAESAVMTAIEMLDACLADCMMVGAVTESGEIHNRIRQILDGRDVRAHKLTEGAASMLLVTDLAAWPGAVELLHAEQWHDESGRQRVLSGLPQPASNAVVISTGSASSKALQGNAWADVTAIPIEARAGTFEGVAGIAIVAAASLALSSRASHALVIGADATQGYAFLVGKSRS